MKPKVKLKDRLKVCQSLGELEVKLGELYTEVYNKPSEVIKQTRNYSRSVIVEATASLSVRVPVCSSETVYMYKHVIYEYDMLHMFSDIEKISIGRWGAAGLNLRLLELGFEEEVHLVKSHQTILNTLLAIERTIDLEVAAFKTTNPAYLSITQDMIRPLTDGVCPLTELIKNYRHQQENLYNVVNIHAELEPYKRRLADVGLEYLNLTSGYKLVD